MLKEYLSQRGLVMKLYYSLDEVLDLAKNREMLTILMGQTFDAGQPIELLKYALFMMNLQDILERSGKEVHSQILLADYFMVDINKEITQEVAQATGNQRRKFLEKVNEIYKGRIRFIYSSDLRGSDTYSDVVDQLLKLKDNSSVFKRQLEHCIPEDRKGESSAIHYPIEEIATIFNLNTDLRVGHINEIWYDIAAKFILEDLNKKNYAGIYLTNSYPYGDYGKIDLPDGILPYKISSKGLARYRINLSGLTADLAKKLIDMTTDKRSLLDLLVICELAEQRLENEIKPSFYSQSSYEQAMKEMNIKHLRETCKTKFETSIGRFFYVN